MSHRAHDGPSTTEKQRSRTPRKRFRRAKPGTANENGIQQGVAPLRATSGARVNADVRWIMKKVIPILIIALAASVFLGGRINLRRKYNRIVNELAPQPYAVVPMSADSTAFLTTALTNWTNINRNGGDLYSAGLNTVGLEPSISNLITLINYRPKQFFLNKTDVAMGKAQALLLPRAIDMSIHLSDDGRLAFIHIRTNAVEVFTDDNGELHSYIYFIKQPRQ